MADKLAADHPLLVEVIESHQDRLRVVELVNTIAVAAMSDKLTIQNPLDWRSRALLAESEEERLRAEVERLRADLALHHQGCAEREVLPGVVMCPVCKQVWTLDSARSSTELFLE